MSNFPPPSGRNRLKTGHLVVRRSPLGPSRGLLRAGALVLPCALGRSGTTVFKREGDGASPVATMRLLHAWQAPKRLPGLHVRLATRRVRADDGWCDAPTHAAYNRPVRLPFPASAETMRRADRLYDFVVVLDWNVRKRARHRGSAIFLHIAAPGLPPTAGCVAVDPRDMMRLAPYLRPGARLTILR